MGGLDPVSLGRHRPELTPSSSRQRTSSFSYPTRFISSPLAHSSRGNISGLIARVWVGGVAIHFSRTALTEAISICRRLRGPLTWAICHWMTRRYWAQCWVVMADPGESLFIASFVHLVLSCPRSWSRARSSVCGSTSMFEARMASFPGSVAACAVDIMG